MMGPRTTPRSPNAAIPPRMLMKTTRPPISARPLISHGRMTLSTLLTITAQNIMRMSPRPQCPETIRLIETGAHQRDKREKSHHHAPEDRSLDPRYRECNATQSSVCNRGYQARGDAREN